MYYPTQRGWKRVPKFINYEGHEVALQGWRRVSFLLEFSQCDNLFSYESSDCNHIFLFDGFETSVKFGQIVLPAPVRGKRDA